MLQIKLKDDKVSFLLDFVGKVHKSARELTRSRILLLSNQQKGITEIAEKLDVFRKTILNIRKIYVEESLLHALSDKSRFGQHIKYT